MNKILELREKRAMAWEKAKNFLDSKRGEDGIISNEDAAIYEKMEDEVVNLGKEIDRLERQEALDMELSKPINQPIRVKPDTGNMEDVGRAGSTSMFLVMRRSASIYQYRVLVQTISCGLKRSRSLA